MRQFLFIFNFDFVFANLKISGSNTAYAPDIRFLLIKIYFAKVTKLPTESYDSEGVEETFPALPLTAPNLNIGVAID